MTAWGSRWLRNLRASQLLQRCTKLAKVFLLCTHHPFFFSFVFILWSSVAPGKP